METSTNVIAGLLVSSEDEHSGAHFSTSAISHGPYLDDFGLMNSGVSFVSLNIYDDDNEREGLDILVEFL